MSRDVILGEQDEAAESLGTGSRDVEGEADVSRSLCRAVGVEVSVRSCRSSLHIC